MSLYHVSRRRFEASYRRNNVDLNKTIVYTYDNGGNLTSKKEYPYTTGTVGTATKTVSYSYDTVGKTSCGSLLQVQFRCKLRYLKRHSRDTSHEVTGMKKYIYFPLWDIEKLENTLEEMEKSGYRLTGVSYSHWFTFKQSTPKQMCYFLSHYSRGGRSMLQCEYILQSEHDAKPIESKGSCYSFYRTKEKKDSLSLLYEVRMDYIRSKLLEYALTWLALTIIFAVLFFLSVTLSTLNKPDLMVITAIMAVCICPTVYYFYGYCKQRSKCRKYEHDGTVHH